MTPTARWAVARRRKRLVINQTLRDRVQTDPRRSSRREAEPPSRKEAARRPGG